MERSARDLEQRRRRARLWSAYLVATACLGAALALVAARLQACPFDCDAVTLALVLPRGAPIESVGSPLPVRPVTPGFIGLSIEYYAVEAYAGHDPRALNPVFLQLIRNLDPGQSPVLRIGGDSADRSWVASPGIARPAGVKMMVTRRLLSVLAALGARLKARLILDLDLEAGNTAVARAEAVAFLRTVGRAHVKAFEIGNEPELYGVVGWYSVNGRPVLGRGPDYNLGDYEREFDAFAHRLPELPLGGPASGLPHWTGNLRGFAATADRLALVTVHRYPLQRCQLEPGTPSFPTVRELLAPQASVGLAQSVIPQAAAAHSEGKAIRVDELNSVACFGARGVSNTSASALWTLETSFAMARVGVDGLNFHTLPAARYGLFSFCRIHHRWFGHVAPDYYGLLTFAAAAPPGSNLPSTSVPSNGLQMWATRTRAGAIRVVLINSGNSTRTVGVRISAAAGSAALSYLRARSLSSQSVTLEGRTFGELTSTGLLANQIPPRPVAVPLVHGLYVVPVPSPSAALLTLSVRRPAA